MAKKEDSYGVQLEKFPLVLIYCFVMISLLAKAMFSMIFLNLTEQEMIERDEKDRERIEWWEHILDGYND